MSFDLRHLDVSEATAEFALPQVSPKAVLIVAAATADNADYDAASKVLVAKRKRASSQVGGRVDAETVAQDRDDDRWLYPRYVIKGWKDVQNRQTGEEVSFTREACRELCEKLPGWLFDRLRLFCLNPENFVKALDFPPASNVAGN